MERQITLMFLAAGKTDPATITATDIRRIVTAELQAGGPPSNNHVRSRLGAINTFYKWCLANGYVERNPVDSLGHLRKQYPRLYGKQQGKFPARWLTHEEAFVTLIGACKDGTWTGSRDQLIIRFGLLGLRLSEIARLQWGHLHDDTITCMGKSNRPRTVRPGPTLLALLAKWRTQTEKQLGRPVNHDDPILCAGRPVHTPGQPRGFLPGPRPPRYGTAMHTSTIYKVVVARAAQAGLGYVAPHDLRRTAAGILHHATTADGAQEYDLLDIQMVLDHADPATTMRSYIDHLNTGAKDRAGHTLD